MKPHLLLKQNITSIAVASWLLSFHHADAAVLALYGNTNHSSTAGTGTTPVSSQANGAAPVTNLTTTAITGNTTVSGNNTIFVRNQFGTDSWISGSSPLGAGAASSDLWVGANNRNWTDGAPSSNDRYFQFTATATGGNTLDLDNLTFNWQAAISMQTVSATFSYQLFASVDGGAYATVGSVGTKSVGNGLGGTTTDWGTITLEDINLNGLDGATSVAFRLAMGADNGAATNDTGSYAQLFRNITLNGQVIPEPSSALLGGLGLLVLLRRRR
jgi:hypothetical protein